MFLAEALGGVAVEDIDPTRALKLGPFELGGEAAAEAIRILQGEDFPRPATLRERTLSAPMYWAIAHQSEGNAEIFGFPVGAIAGLPTAIEIALVRAVAASPVEQHESIFAGGIEISLGNPAAYSDFSRILSVTQSPMAGESLLFNKANQAIIDRDISNRLTELAIKCISNSFRVAPLKFRFLEIYRIMEARFLADIRSKLFANFDTEPSVALGDALETLKSEMNQIAALAETQQDAFEACWTALDTLKNTNRFCAALFRNVEKKGRSGGGTWKTGAALIYQIRCAIVHAGEKDMIFDNFIDGDAAVEAVLPYAERAALLLVGVDIVED